MYVRLPTGTDAPEPQLLSTEVIEEILESFPRPKAADGIVAEHARLQLMADVRRQLQVTKFVPLPEVYEEIRDLIINIYNSSTIKSGDNVGIGVAAAFSVNLMQLTLNTFHFAGVATGVGAGFKGIESMLYTVKNRRDTSCTVHFTVPISPHDVAMLVPLMTEITVKGLTSKIDYVEVQPQQYGVPMSEDVLALYDWWHLAYEIATNKKVRGTTSFMRLTMNKKRMYQHRVTMQDICSMMVDEEDSITIVPSPFEQGYIDIFVNNIAGINESVPEPTRSLYYLQTSVETQISTLRIKGIPGIKSIHPVTTPVVSALSNPRKLNDVEIDSWDILANPALPANPQRSRLWKNEIDHKIIRGRGVPINSLILLMKMSGIVIVNVIRNDYGDWPIKEGKPGSTPNTGDIDEIWCYVPSDDEKANPPRPNTPNVHLTRYIDKVLSDETKIASRKDVEAKYGPINVNTLGAWRRTIAPGDAANIKLHSELESWMTLTETRENVEQLSKYTYVITNGSNLTEICKLPWVDTCKTHSNNTYELTSVIGCEAARMYVTYEIVEVLNASAIKINSRHITLMADYMFYRGFPVGVRANTAASRNTKNFLSKSTSDRTFGVYAEASRYGLSETTDNVPSSIMTGEVPKIGGNAFHLFRTQEDQERMLKIHQDNVKLHQIIKDNAKAVEAAMLARSVQSAVSKDPPNVTHPSETIIDNTTSVNNVVVPTVMNMSTQHPNPPASQMPPPHKPPNVAPIISAVTARMLAQLVNGWMPIGLTVTDINECPAPTVVNVEPEVKSEPEPASNSYTSPDVNAVQVSQSAGILPSEIENELQRELEAMRLQGSTPDTANIAQ